MMDKAVNERLQEKMEELSHLFSLVNFSLHFFPTVSTFVHLH